MSSRNRPRHKDVILPNARRGVITDLNQMLNDPQHGQVGRFPQEKQPLFNKTRYKQDPVLRVMRSTIRTLKISNLAIFEPNFKIKAADSAPPLWPLDPTSVNFGIKIYKFEHHEEDWLISQYFPVAIFPPGVPPTAENIYLYKSKEKKFLLLKEWIFSINNSERLICWSGVRAQRKWWKFNKKPFRLMDLPKEIRLQIYEHALGGAEIYPLVVPSQIPEFDAEWTLAFGLGYRINMRWGQIDPSEYCPVAEVRLPVCKPNYALLSVSKVVRDECLYVGWTATRKCFNTRWRFAAVLKAKPGVAANYNHLGKVQLNFTNKEYFEFLGINIHGGLFHATDSNADCLAKLPKDTDLQLRFRSPDDGGYGCPWGNHPETNNRGSVVCCQRTMVDWIMTFAFPHVKHFRKTVLVGAVKPDTKTKWEAVLADAQAGKAHYYNEIEAIDMVLKTSPNELPPRCSCRKPCKVPFGSRFAGFGFRSQDDFDYEDGSEEGSSFQVNPFWAENVTSQCPRLDDWCRWES